MNELALFAGAGGGILGGHLLGWRCVCAVEWNAYAASVLAARQNDGLLPPFPIWDDVRTFDGRPWRGLVDVVSGGFPCQDISIAGKGIGIVGERSALWREFARIVGEVRPQYVFVENSPMLVTRGLGVVVGDLASMGYDSRWGVVSAADAGAPHQRDRIWIVADSGSFRHRSEVEEVRTGRNSAVNGGESVADAYGERELQPEGSKRDERRRTSDGGHSTPVADTERRQPQVERNTARVGRVLELGAKREPDFGSFAIEPDVGRVADGVPARLDRLRCLGNAQVPQAAALAWRTLTGNLKCP